MKYTFEYIRYVNVVLNTRVARHVILHPILYKSNIRRTYYYIIHTNGSESAVWSSSAPIQPRRRRWRRDNIFFFFGSVLQFPAYSRHRYRRPLRFFYDIRFATVSRQKSSFIRDIVRPVSFAAFIPSVAVSTPCLKTRAQSGRNAG